MKISVIVTTYNRSTYIVEAINSILHQTEGNFELIVIDDGSTDDTEAILLPFRDRIRFRRIAHAGPAAARNAGMEMAHGEYVCFLDSDDRYHRAKLALQSKVLDQFPDIAWVSTEISAFDDNGRWEEFHLRDYHEPAYRRGGITFESLYNENMSIAGLPGIAQMAGIDANWMSRKVYVGSIFDVYLVELVVFAVSIMFRRSLLSLTGMQNPRLEYFEEREFALRLCRGQRVAFVDVPLYQHRYHPGQMSTNVGPRSQWIRIRKQQDLLHVLRMHGLRDREYYATRRDIIDHQLARLCRAVAIPMLGFTSPSAFRRRCFPARARVYLRYAAARGHSQPLLMLASLLPPFLRRIVMKLESIARRTRARHGT
jgi:glycosyltransferase involved in cell wall biosynthesis